jgi:hypothetical protein
LATNPEERPEERQRRELEEIRRKFHEVGARLGSAFEPTTPTIPAGQAQPRALPPAPPPDRSARPGWQWLAAVVLIFVAGTGLGSLLPRSGGGAQPPPPSPQPSATTAAAPQTKAAPRPRAVVPPACLETARLADQTIHLLVTNVRTRRLAEALKAYTLASQACREEASP